MTFKKDLNEDLTFSAHYYQDIPLILGDEKQIAQIIINLLNNAANYTEAGSISITTSWNDERNQVRIEIKDTGIGVPSQEIGHLFERFYRGSNVSQSNIPGTGLGLSVVKELVNLHQGEIKIESELNVGATVTLFLPGAPRLSSEQWTVNSGQWTVNSGQWTVDSGQWTVDSGQWTVNSGQWTVNSGQWTVDSGQ
ncbi:MAG: ATP-binding protein [Chloroflexi bacterium]|nr:ATP-binding protein [Chloroflexota bacterium]